MKKLLITACLVALAGSAYAADPADGVWKTQKGQVKSDGSGGGYLYVQIGECGAKICGTIVKAFDKEGKDDPKYEHIGKPIIKDMSPDGSGYYSGGTIWAPDEDKTYVSKMYLNGDVLTVKGCVLGGLICRGQDWNRVK